MGVVAVMCSWVIGKASRSVCMRFNNADKPGSAVLRLVLDSVSVLDMATSFMVTPVRGKMMDYGIEQFLAYPSDRVTENMFRVIVQATNRMEAGKDW